MSASQSFLSSPEYGYDYVVAVTQDSINATALTFLGKKEPVVNACYVYDDNGDPTPMAYEELKKKAKGTDPFKVPDSGPDRETQLTNLYNAGFMFGFQAAMGRPDGFDVAKLPDIVTLGPTAGDPITYSLLCKHFLLVELNTIPGRKPVFHTFAQPKGPQGEFWLFTYAVPLTDESVKDNKAFLKSPEFGTLPAGVQNKLTEKPEDFTIRHLLFDFNKAAGKVRPTITGVNPKLREKLDVDFAIKYFTEMQAGGPPIVAVTPSSGDQFAGLKTEFSVNPLPAQPKFGTLNYLCSTAGHTLPPSKSFTWNWVESTNPGEIDGVCVINRSDLIEQLKSQLAPYIDKNSYLPQPVYIYVDLVKENAAFRVVPRTFVWDGGKVPDNLKQHSKLYEHPGALLLHWEFGASRENDESYFNHGGGDSFLRVETGLDLRVYASGNTLIIEQHIVVRYCLKIQAVVENTTLVDIHLTDTFTLAAAGDKVTASISTHKEDKSEPPQYWGSAPKVQEQMNDTKKSVMENISSSFFDVPLSLVQNVIFPGGKAFFFKDVEFSDNQDLVAHITYKG
jgi:hypothetical protein